MMMMQLTTLSLLKRKRNRTTGWMEEKKGQRTGRRKTRVKTKCWLLPGRYVFPRIEYNWRGEGKRVRNTPKLRDRQRREEEEGKMVVIIIISPYFFLCGVWDESWREEKNHTRYEKVREKEIDFTKEKKGEETFDFPYLVWNDKKKGLRNSHNM